MDLKKQDSKQNGLSSVNYMQKQSSKKDSQKPRYMMMLRKLILEKFLESRYSQEDSHVRTSQMLERELASRGVVLHSGNITLKRLAKYDQESHSLKTSQLSLVEGYLSYSATLPRSGMMQNGIVYQLPPLVRITRGTGSSSFATQTTMDSLPPKSEKALKREMEVTRKGRSKPANLRDQVSNMQMWRTPSATECMRGIGKMSIEEKKKNNIQISLSAQVQMFPTPMASDWKNKNYSRDYTLGNKKYLMLPTPKAHDGKNYGNPENPCIKKRIKMGKQIDLNMTESGSLNPMWVEWLMGFPLGWTELIASEMQSYRNLRKSLQKLSKNEMEKDV